MKKLLFWGVILFIPSFLFGEFIPVKDSFPFNAYSMEDDTLVSAEKLNRPIGEGSRIVVGEDGHLYSGGKRLRIFGTNLSEFPSKENGEFAAKNLARQGYNCIRFHHTDANWTNCFLKKDATGKWIINEERLDDFDYFFAELKKAGIYTNINLLTGRSMSSADGFHSDIDKASDMKSPHSLGFWYEPALEYQKKYAFDLLTHVNPYTGLSYCEDPAVAIVEINNENGFLMAYLSGWIDCYKNTVFWDDLERQWNKWLLDNNHSYEDLALQYNKAAPVLGNIIASDKKGFLEQHSGAEAALSLENNVHKIAVKKNGQSSWHIQYGFSGLDINEEKIYTIRFEAKATAPCSISVALSQAHDPWKNAGFEKKLNLSTTYENYEFIVSGQMTDKNLRLIFSSMGYLEGKTVFIKNLKMTEGGEVTVVTKNKKNNLVLFPASEEFKALPADYKNYILNFVWEKEYEYWQGMKDYLRKDLNCKALVMGTAMGCSTTCIQNIFDIIDSHAYWNHPSFPSNSWDAKNYYVHNNSLTKADKGSTLVNLAKYRVFGKPFSVSEYDHPYPNQFSSESYPMISSFGAFQDWDCIFTFCSELPKPNEINKLRTSGYFDQSRNPVKACAAPFAARIFRNFMVEPADKSVYVRLDEKKEKALLYKNHAWSIGNPEMYGLNPEMAKVCKIGLVLDEKNIPENASEKMDEKPSLKNQIYWDCKNGIYAVNNSNLSITISAPKAMVNTIPTEYLTDSLLPPFKSDGDFAVFTAIKEDNHIIALSSRWTGNRQENLKEYGKKSVGTGFYLTRDEINLTTSPLYNTGTAEVLNSQGSISGKQTHTLYTIDKTGRKAKKVSSGKELRFSSADETLWYLIE
ncbi:MAG: carbohydrate binding domain-containing protein [Treponema sp.]|nr:carbohydrate binding domain-containing protein [Treponema sp.]